MRQEGSGEIAAAQLQSRLGVESQSDTGLQNQSVANRWLEDDDISSDDIRDAEVGPGDRGGKIIAHQLNTCLAIVLIGVVRINDRDIAGIKANGIQTVVIKCVAADGGQGGVCQDETIGLLVSFGILFLRGFGIQRRSKDTHGKKKDGDY